MTPYGASEKRPAQRKGCFRMLDRSIELIAVGRFFGGFHVTRLLSKMLAEQKSALREPAGKFASALASDIDDAWPRHFRLNEIEYVSRELCDDGIVLTPHLPILDYLFRRAFVPAGGSYQYRTDQVGWYSSLLAEVDPSVVLCWQLSKQLPLNADGYAVFETSVAALAPLLAPSSAPSVADNHVHLGGISAAELLLSRHLFTPVDVPRNQRVELKREGIDEQGGEQSGETFTLLRRVVAALLKLDYGQPESSKHISAVRAAASPSNWKSADVPDWWSLKTGQEALTDRASWLRVQIAQCVESGHYSRAWVWLHIYLWSHYQDARAAISTRAAVLLCLGGFSVLRRSIISEGRGLRRFVGSYYSASLRSEARNKFAAVERVDAMTRLLVHPEDRAELKIAPPDFSSSNVRAVLRAMRLAAGNTLAEDLESGDALARQAYAADMERVHFCAHFIRRPASGIDGGTDALTTARRTRRRGVWDEAEKLSNELAHNAGWQGDEFLTDHAHCRFSNWVRGLDVAGDETAWPIEYFAPQLRWVRATRKDSSPLHL
ncbi:MAG: hypothetical protein Q7T70_18860, partial [Polaromonas sp.]|nr:hypothetical protein [Polaromonas sp.]